MSLNGMRIVLIGFGEVGQSLAQTLERNGKHLLHRYGLRPRIVAITDSNGAAVNPSGLDLHRILKIKREQGSVSMDEKCGRPQYNTENVISRYDSDVVIEATATNLSTGEPALSHIRTALSRRQHVITVNKGPLALTFPALMELATYNQALLRFSGTVGGGTPILDLGRKSLHGDHIVTIQGILNGTTNYILSRMMNDSISKDAALKEAQLVGYAEADPTMDVEGFDSAAKLVILANYVLERPITLKDVDVTGISNVTFGDIQQVKEKNCVVKLLATISDNEVSVRPQLLPIEHPLNVDGVLNAVTFSTDIAGDITITGKGAGGYETAGAIIRDLINIHQTL